MFDYFPFCEAWIDNNLGRISSVTFEPPAFAAYLTSISGWMFSYIITHKDFKSYIPGLLVIIFAFLSGSRAGFAIIIVQIIGVIVFFVKRKTYHKLLAKGIVLFSLILLAVIIFKGKEILTKTYVDNTLSIIKMKQKQT